jgi:hypothetical protein
MQQEAYPVRFTVDYPDRPLDRLTTGFRIFVAIPILIVLGTVSGGGSWESSYDNTRTTTVAAGGLLSFGPLLMILFRQKYPGGGSTGTWSCSGSATGWAPTWR